MRLSEVAMTTAITVSIAGLSYAALNTNSVRSTTQTVANQATCRTVEAAVVGYVAQNGTAPTDVGQLRPWIDGDVSAYRIVRGRVAGPGC